MATFSKLVDVSQELSTLKHEQKNKTMKNLPSNMTTCRRPLLHPAIASPHAGSHVQKVVYVSRRTPVMSAVKRVKKLLQHIEKRTVQSADSRGKTHAQRMSDLANTSDKPAQTAEEVLVKASGRAMEQALRIGEWFRTKENELLCKVDVRTSSVAAIDDIVELEEGIIGQDTADDKDEETIPANNLSAATEETTLEGGDTTMEILGNRADTSAETAEIEAGNGAKAEDSMVKKRGTRRKRKRKREMYDKDEVPEARIRWVKTVEVAISLRA